MGLGGVHGCGCNEHLNGQSIAASMQSLAAFKLGTIKLLVPHFSAAAMYDTVVDICTSVTVP